jgi:hypothetical protein
MNTPTTHSRVNEFCSPVLNNSTRLSETALNRLTPETTTRWRVNRIFWIKDAPPNTMLMCHDQRVSRSTEPEHLGFRCWSGDVEVDVKSPITEEAFHAMPFMEQVGFLRTWKPNTSNWDGPVREGLAAIVQAEATVQSVCYFEHSDRLTGLDPLYSTALVRGFSEGLDGKTVSNWKPFWLFATRVLEQPDPDTQIRDDFSGNTQLGRRWQSCRLEIARLVDAILDGKLAPLPLIERKSVWQLIAALMRDPRPASAEETHDDEQVMDHLALSLNTAWGVAVHAVFSFVRWIRSHSSDDVQCGQDLDDVPEARDALEALLDPRIESALTIRSVFGANMPRLAFWAETWLRDHLERIFPIQGQIDQSEIAWKTFIRLSHTNLKTFVLFRQQYSAAIARMPQNVLREHRHRDSRVSLGKILVVSYCRGILDFEQPDNMLEAFFTRAPESVRAEVMAFVGRSLAQSDGPILPEILERLLTLWNWLVQHESPSGGPGSEYKAA